MYNTALSASEIQAHCATGAAPSLPALITQVQGLSQLNTGQRKALTSTLNAASDSLDRGNTTAAWHQLNAFINQVNAFSSRLDTATATSLINQAQQIRAQLECS